MRCGQLSMLCVLTLHSSAKSLATSWDYTRVKHTWNDLPPNWESLGPPPVGTTIDLNIVLMPHDENALIDSLYKVSDPTSTRYGAHLSREQVAQLVVPHQDTLELVHSWIQSHDIPPSSISLTHGGSWLTLSSVPVVRANDLLCASYQLYRHTGTNNTGVVLRTIGYSLPVVLHTHVRTVVPTTYFSMRPLWQMPLTRSVNTTADMTSSELGKMLLKRDDDDDDDGDDDDVTPAVLRSLYRMENYVPAATHQNILGVTGFSYQYPSATDFITFMTRCRSDAVDPVFTLVPVNNGGYDPNNPGPEANVNIQYTEALTYPTPIIFYSIGGIVKFDPEDLEPTDGDAFLEWLKFVTDKAIVPQTITISYSVLETYVPPEYGTVICDMFAELGARGASVLIASGNNGVGPTGNCLDHSGRFQFVTEFPPTCPFVTTVGGTTGMDPEIAADFSGGGFSSIFPRPPYQDAAVTTFLQRLGGGYNGFYKASGRAIPDISAQATDFFYIKNNLPQYGSGTSLSAPTVASIISLLNDYRLSTGRTPLGFLNPWLYGHGRKGITDITSGFNPGCGTQGFPATVGWDPVTGLGTPDFLLLQYTLDYIPTPGN